MRSMRIMIVGNSGGGKSLLARRIARDLQLPCVELDSILWLPGWKLAPPDDYDRDHARLLAREQWILEGLGSRTSLPARCRRATHIILIDLPLWAHFWLAAERHVAWSEGQLKYPPAGSPQPPPLKALFKTIAEVDRDWMPDVRRLVAVEETAGKRINRILSFDALEAFQTSSLQAGSP
jgi:adenylate kinase family enzyme